MELGEAARCGSLAEGKQTGHAGEQSAFPQSSGVGWVGAGEAEVYFPVSIFRLMMMSFLLSKELMDLTALFFPETSAQTS